MEHIVCPVCGHDHGRAWRYPMAECGVLVPVERGGRHPCGCAAPMETALLASLARATYVLAAATMLQHDASAGIVSITDAAHALRAVMEPS